MATIPEPDQHVSHPFSDPTPDSDLILLVEEERLHVNKVVLSLASSVFQQMFEAKFPDKSSQEITLPGKKCADMREFFLCIYPSTYKPVTRENLDIVLPLAHEYQVKQLVDRCEEFVLNQFQMEKKELKYPKLIELVHFLFLAEKYDLNILLKVCIEKMAARRYTCTPLWSGSRDGVGENKEFQMLSYKTKYEILQKRMQLLETVTFDILREYDVKEKLQKMCFLFD